MIRVINKRDCSDPGEYIGRGSILGNRWSHKDGTKAEFRVKTRAEAIDSFDDWLDDLPHDSPQWMEINRLADIYRQTGELTLVCYCAPMACHGHVISRRIRNMVDGQINP